MSYSTLLTDSTSTPRVTAQSPALQPGDTLLTRPPALTAEQVQQILGAGRDKTVNINGVDYGTVGLATNDEGGQSYTAQGIVGYAPGTYNQAGAHRAEYDLNGNFTRVGANMSGGSYNVSDFADAIEAASFLYSFYSLGQGLQAFMSNPGAQAGGATATAGADSVQGNSINALDRATGVAYGSEASGSGGSLLTGPASAPAGTLEGNAGQGLNFGSRSGTGLTMGNAPNLDVMNGGQGLTTTGAQALGNPASFINDPTLQLAEAGGQTVSGAGIFPNYTPSLGDPSSFVNGGTAGTAGAAPGWNMSDVIKGIQMGGQLAGLLGAGGSLGGGQASYSSGGVGGTADTSNRAGLAPGTQAQGGAAGSIQGVADTLLTAKDTFGYGKTLLT